MTQIMTNEREGECQNLHNVRLIIVTGDKGDDGDVVMFVLQQMTSYLDKMF